MIRYSIEGYKGYKSEDKGEGSVGEYIDKCKKEGRKEDRIISIYVTVGILLVGYIVGIYNGYSSYINENKVGDVLVIVGLYLIVYSRFKATSKKAYEDMEIAINYKEFIKEANKY